MTTDLDTPAFTDLTDKKTAKLFRCLKGFARNWQLIPYEHAAFLVDLPAWRKPFTCRLGAISEHTWETDEVILSALIVRKHEGTPNPLFYEFLETLMTVPADEAGRLLLWAKLVREVHKFYGEEI